MKKCICGELAHYFCKTHDVVTCKNHKAGHEEGKEMYETYSRKKI